MHKTVIKIFGTFVLSAAVIATALLCINFMGFAILGTDTSDGISAKQILLDLSQNLVQGENGLTLIDQSVLPPAHWAMVIDPNGQVIWSENLPADVPSQYSLNDIARMTRWFLADYPVYVQTEDYGLLVLGLPKNALGKYEIAYSMSWFHTLPQRILGVLVLNLCLATVFACVIGIQLYRRLRQLMRGIRDLGQEKSVHLREKGIFREVSHNLNQASQIMERKNLALAARDNARSNWIAGISHDIRTPLSVVTGYAEALATCGALSDENRKKAQAVLQNSMKIERLIEDLNLISSMEYDMQPSQKVPVKLCPLLRRVTADIVNGGLPERFTIHLDLRAERAVVLGDEALLERAVTNLIHNAVTHNQNGCEIHITEEIVDSWAQIVLMDNGSGVPDAVLSRIHEIPKTTHGIGLPMAYRIIHVHGGSFTAYNRDGFVVKIRLPLQ